MISENKKGRPKKDIVDKFRTMVWYAAVKQRSGFETAYMLGKHFSPEQFRRGPDGESIYPSKWNKYKRGDTVPSNTLVKHVESEFKGTARWLELTLWDVIRKKPPSIIKIKAIVSTVRPGLAKHISGLKSNIPKQDSRRLYSTTSIDSLWRQGDLDSLAALFALIRDAELKNNNFQYIEASVASMYVILRQLIKEPLYTVRHDLFQYVQTSYFNFTPDKKVSLFPIDIEAEEAIEQLKNAINIAQQHNIIGNTDNEISRLSYWMWREGVINCGICEPETINKNNISQILKKRMQTNEKNNPNRWPGILQKTILESYHS